MEKIASFTIAPNVELYHLGPPLEQGPLPSLFYFSISGTDSLTLDPFNQPVQFLKGEKIRIFSLTLPFHEPPLLAKDSMQYWAEVIGKGEDILTPFIDIAMDALNFAIQQKLTNPSKIATAGLSRGGFVASHFAARDARIGHLLAFAPLTRLSSIKEFQNFSNLSFLKNFDLLNLSSSLCNKHIRLYIGNRDQRVSTEACYEFFKDLVEKASEQNIRNIPIELFITPSIGAYGHGTPPEIFQQGAAWISNALRMS